MKTKKIYTITVTAYNNGNLASVPICFDKEEKARKAMEVAKREYKSKYKDFVVVCENDDMLIIFDSKEPEKVQQMYYFSYLETNLN